MSNNNSKYINRELSWLEFNQRVLDEAIDDTVPLLERLTFLAITASNLDEFFMVRVGGLQALAASGNRKRDPSGLTPRGQLKAIEQRTTEMVSRQYDCLLQELEPALALHGINRLNASELTDRQLEDVSLIIDNEVLSVLTPIAVTSADDFPLLANQTINVCVRLAGGKREKSKKTKRGTTQDTRYAIIPIGKATHRFLTLHSEGGYAYALLEDLVSHFAQRFFSGEEILECAAFRITRNADVSVREDQAPDLLKGMEEVLDWRKQSHCVRIEIAASASDQTRQFLSETLEVSNENVVSVAGPLDLGSFMRLTDIQGFDHLQYESWPPMPNPHVDMTASMFEVLSHRDILLYHPYESFEPVVKLVEEAADDPDVLAIKQTLYRTSANSPIIAALARAAKAGKYVTVIVELKARFDEARNIEQAKALEQAGAQVIYGVKDLKTHSKVCIIVRREPHGIQRYVHFGTGNYNESTAKIYSDASFMTCNEELGADAISFFNAVTGYSQPQQFRKIEAAPIGLRERLLEMIEIETQQKRQGRKARIVAKLNSLVDNDIIDALCEASSAGVQVKLNIRGICCLRPGVKGLSESISVVSIVDRFLEHARIFCFYHGGDERVFLSSADWMPRNLDRRVELLVPIENNECRQRLIQILDQYFLDNVKAKELMSDGSYRQVERRGRRKVHRSQKELYDQACAAIKQLEQSKRTVFQPHRAPAEES